MIYSTGHPYDKVWTRLNLHKVSILKAKTIRFLKGLSSAGLKATSMTVESVGGKDIVVPFIKTNRRRLRHTLASIVIHTANKEIAAICYYEKYYFNAYHEIASLFPTLPRTHEVYTNASICIFSTYAHKNVTIL